jgi:hypothetical protein
VPVTKQVYTVSPTWTAAQLATAFENAFIDAGLMTAWHDSFLSGSVENRVLAVDYGTGTYSVTYYWFMFTTTGVFYSLATGWNTGSHIPSGTQYLDYVLTTTNATTGHTLISPTLSTATTATITRYSSAITSGYAWFVIKTGSTTTNFHIARAGVVLHSWIDLTKTVFHNLFSAVSTMNSNGSFTLFSERVGLRRSFCFGTSFSAGNSIADFTNNLGISRFVHQGFNASTGGNSSNIPSSNHSILLPSYNSSVNPAFSSNSNPVFTGLVFNPYINEVAPSDFALGGITNAIGIAVNDKIIVSAGVEEYEFLSAASSASGVLFNQGGLLARVV